MNIRHAMVEKFSGTQSLFESYPLSNIIINNVIQNKLPGRGL